VILERRSRFFFRVFYSIKELEGPSMLDEDKVLAREEFEDKFKIY